MLPPTRAAIRRLAPDAFAALRHSRPALRAPSASRVLATVAASSAAAPVSASTTSVRQLLTSPRRLLFGHSISEVFGHSSFVLAGTAFLDPDIFNLRLLSVASGSANLIFSYFHPVGKPLWLPFGWNLAFMAINCGHIYRIQSEHWQAQSLPPQALNLWRAVFQYQGVSAVDFSKLLAAGTWTTLRKGATLQQEGELSASVFLVVAGGADVWCAGKKSHRIHDHQFIGDMGLSSGISVTSPLKGVATVTTNQQTTALVWPRSQLLELLDANPKLAQSFQAALAADVMRKMRDPEREDDEEQRNKSRDLWRARYASVLSAVLSAGEVDAVTRKRLQRYRELCSVGEDEHSHVLATNGWSAAQYEHGTNSPLMQRKRDAEAEARAARRAESLAETEGAAALAAPQTGAEQTGLPQRQPSLVGGEMRRKRVGNRTLSRTLSAPTSRTPLRMWDTRRSEVSAVQERLNLIFGTKLAPSPLTVDGNYGPLTQQAVELFQLKQGLAVTGNVDPHTWSKLREGHLQRLQEDSLLPLVRSFDDKVDIDVVMLQQKLQLVVGEDCCKVDGVYGPRTTRAVAIFLEQKGLARPNLDSTDGGTGDSADGMGRAIDASAAVGSPSQITPHAQEVLQEAFLSELESRALPTRSTTDGEPVTEAVLYDANVKLLQISLNQVMGRKMINPDGIWGPKTRRAVDEFQQMFGLPLGGDVAEQVKTVSMVLHAVAAEDCNPNADGAAAKA